MKHGNEAIQPAPVSDLDADQAAAQSWLCLWSVAFLVVPPFASAALSEAASHGQGNSGPIPWAATVAVAVGALWGQGVMLGGWGARVGSWRGPWRAAAALALPLGIGALGLAAVPSGPLPFGRLPDPLGAAEALAGLMAVGVFLGLGRFGGWAPVWAVALAVMLDGAPAGWGLLKGPPGSASGGAPWDPGVAAILLDGSPRAFVMESGAVDWMRHPEVYGPVGTDRIGPELRTGWVGSVAPHVTLLLSCVAVTWRCFRPLESRVIEGLEPESEGP